MWAYIFGLVSGLLLAVIADNYSHIKYAIRDDRDDV